MHLKRIHPQPSVIQRSSSEINRLNGEVDTMRGGILSGKQTVEESTENVTDAEKSTSKEIGKSSLASSIGMAIFGLFRAKQSAVRCEMSGQADNVTVCPATDPG